DFSALQVEQRIDGGLPVPEDAAQFPALPVASTEKLSKRNCGPSEFRTDGPAQKLVLVEDADFGHVPRVETQRYGFPDVRRKRRRNVAETLEVNAIHSHLS